ncbi:wee1-like protein kinase isoform X2 [Euphorbia lathyris]|uniref:wee1-like protein kinase isoform X2 n=1 Tax=Euphorbia lathyris TaxID=212925 RepID=UPI0033141DEE
MKRKTLNRSNRKRTETKKMKGTLARHLQVQLGQISVIPLKYQQSSSSTSIPKPSSLFQNLLDSEATDKQFHSLSENPTVAADIDLDDKHFILSQDFFCTPDYITPVDQNLLNSLDCNKENILCPDSPEKMNTVKTKKLRRGSFNPLNPGSFHQKDSEEIEEDTSSVEVKIEKTAVNETQKCQNYVSQSAVALRCRVMPPPCIKNPYLMDASEVDVDPFCSRRSKCAGFFSANIGGDGLSRYLTDFQEIQQIGSGNFSRVFKVLKRIDGCLYAVKQSTRKLHQDADRRKALMEVQALAALGCHENIVGYYSSWFESEQLYIQMELCDCSLSTKKSSKAFTEGEVLEILHQFIHERGIAHLDVKPDNIYVKNGVHKLGDFGCATLLNQSLPIEEGDARYMPQEILNEIYDHLDKVDIFSLGASIYELIRGSPLPQSGSQFFNLREGKLPLLPGHSLQFQNLLKVMIDPDPVQRPSAKELVENPLFDKVQTSFRI